MTEEIYKIDLWLKDDPSKPKIFALAGFFPIPGVSGPTMKVHKDEIIQKLSSLGGRYAGSDEWDPSVTHVITYVDGKKEGMSEKVMAAIAAGRWVLTKRYVEKSYKAKEWIEAPRLFAHPRDAVLRNRKNWFLQGPRGGPFWGMRAVLVMEDERKNGVYGRIIVAGGGTVRKEVHTLRQLTGVLSLLADGQVTHVFLDPWDVKSDSFSTVKRHVDSKALKIWFLHYKFLFLTIRGSTEPSEEEHSVMNKQVREMGEREMGSGPVGQRGEQGNKKRRGSESGNSRKKQRGIITEVVTVLSDDDDCVTIVDVEANGIKEKENVDVCIDTDDDDDITVLEQKLANSRAAAGSGRQYMERGKATGEIQSYKEMCDQQRREQLGSRRKSLAVGVGMIDEMSRQCHQEVVQLDGPRNRRPSNALGSSVQVISLSDDETEMVTLDDSDDDITLVATTPLPPAKVATNVSHILRSPSPVLMELDQDEREDSGDESDICQEIVQAQDGAAPEVFDVDSDDEVQAVPPHAPSPILSPSPRFSSDEMNDSCPDSPGVEQSHELPVSGDSLVRRSVPSSKVITDQLIPFMDTQMSALSSVRFEEPIEPSLEFDLSEDLVSFEDPIDVIERKNLIKETEKDLIRKAILNLAKDDNVTLVTTDQNGKNAETNLENKNCEMFSNKDVKANIVKETFQPSKITIPIKHHSIIDSPTYNKINSFKMLRANNQLKVHRRDTPPMDQVHHPVTLVKVPTFDKSLEASLESQLSLPSPLSKSSALVMTPVAEITKSIPLAEITKPIQAATITKPRLAAGITSPKPAVEITSPKPAVEITKPIPVASPSSPVPDISQTASKSTLLHRIIATLVKRMAVTDEAISISNINSRTVKFDKHSERRIKGEKQAKQVHQNVEMDFSGYFKDETETLKVTNKKRNTNLADNFHDDGITANDSVASIRRLKIETTSSAFPSSSLLNTVLKKLLLEEKDINVRILAYEYACHFLFLHLGKESLEREQWLVLVLSACRNLPEQKLFKSFDITNIHDIQSCWNFFRHAVADFVATANYEGGGESLEGPQMFFDILVKILKKDFELWWKHWRRRDESNRLTSYPLLYYIHGGSRSSFLQNMSKTVLKLYKLCLGAGHSQLLPVIRHLVSMSALLVSHLDYQDGYMAVNQGEKVTLAKYIGEMLSTSLQLTANNLYLELSLLQPNWLSLLVSKYIYSQAVDMGDSLGGIKHLVLADQGQAVVMAVDNWAHKICGLQQAHAIFRANWHYVRNGRQQFRTFKHLSRLEEKGVNLHNKMFKIEDVGLRLSEVVDSVNVIRGYANNNFQQVGREVTGVSALAAFFFQMSFVDTF